MIVKKIKLHNIFFKGHHLKLGEKTCIMGVLNVTPDSFSDGGRYINPSSAITRGIKMADEGADIIDIGGESTRPFSNPVSEKDEIARVIPVIKKLAKHISIPISIDTTKARVAEEAVFAGASVINDISAFTFDSKMADIAAKHGTAVILMHIKGKPKTMQVLPSYKNLIKEICLFLEDAVKRAVEKNIEKTRIIIDPGIGFGKSFDHNLQIINNIDKFNFLNLPILVGPSRKAFIKNILQKQDNDKTKSCSFAVETGTQAAVSASILNGAHIVRVHNIADTIATTKIIDAVKCA